MSPRDMRVGAAVGAATVMLLLVIPLVIILVLQQRAIEPYVAIGRAFRAGGVSSMAATARTYLPRIQQDISSFTKIKR